MVNTICAKIHHSRMNSKKVKEGAESALPRERWGGCDTSKKPRLGKVIWTAVSRNFIKIATKIQILGQKKNVGGP